MKYLLVLLAISMFFIGCGDDKRENLTQTPDATKDKAPKLPKSADGVFTAGDDQNVLEGDSVVLNMSIFDKDKDFKKYTWKNGDKTISQSPKLQLDDLEAGKHHITLEAEDSEGNIYIDNISIIIKKEDENNTAPVADDLTFILNEDGTYKGSLSGSDLDGDNLSYLFVSQPTNGSLRGSAANLRYTPDANFFGEDSFLYKTNDSTIDSKVANVNIIVNSVNDIPIANEQNITIIEDETKTIILSGTDADNDNLTFTVVDAPTNGDFNGTIYTPNANFFGEDSFTFKSNDGQDNSSLATVTIMVNSINDAPIATTNNVTLNEDNVADIILSGMDAENSNLIYEIARNPQNGTLSLAGNTATYTPNANFNGQDNFSFKSNDGSIYSDEANVTITVNSVNDAPTANEQNITTNEDETKTIILSGTDADNDNLTFTVVDAPTNGSFNGTIYTPNANFFGIDSFTFKSNDGQDNSSLATVTIMVNSVNDAPIASNDFNQTDEDSNITFNVLTNDIDVDSSITLAAVTALGLPISFEQNGSVTFSPIGHFDYLPEDEEHHVTFSYSIKDEYNLSSEANITITIIGIDDDINIQEIQAQDINLSTENNISGTISASDIDSNVVFINGMDAPLGFEINSTTGAYIFTPDDSYKGLNLADVQTINIPITIQDTNKIIQIDIIGKNDAPVAVNDISSVSENGEVFIDVLANDTDADSNALLSVKDLTILRGNAFLRDGKIWFNATGFEELKVNEELNTTFSYTIKDEYNETSTANITVTITGINDAPQVDAGEDINVSFGENINFLANASDIDGNIASYLWETNGITLSQTQSFFKDDLSEGTHTIKLTVTDDDSAIATDEINVVVVQYMKLPPTHWNDINFSKTGSIVTDHSTELMWQDNVNLYQTWTEANATCDSLSLDTFTDWRLPNIHEIFFLAKKGTAGVLGSTFSTLPQTQAPFYWSSNEFNNFALVADFVQARQTKANISQRRYVRCVRGKELTFNFTRDDVEKVVIDKVHKLMWADDANTNLFADAAFGISSCNDAIIAGFSDWRLPNIHELYSIVEPFKSNPATNEVFQKQSTEGFWSSTSYSYSVISKSYIVRFNTGVMDAKDTANSFNIRCVRDIP